MQFPRASSRPNEILAGLFTLLLIAGCGSGGTSVVGVAPGPSFSLGDPYVTVRVDARVTGVTDPGGVLGGAVSVGDGLGGRYLYDESVPDSHKKVDSGRYVFEDPPCGVSLAVAGLEFASEPGSPLLTIKLLNDKNGSTVHDSYEAKSATNLDVLPGVAVGAITMMLSDDTASAIDDDVLAGLDLSMSGWTSTEIVISGPDGWRIEATLAALDDDQASDERGRGHRKDNFNREN